MQTQDRLIGSEIPKGRVKQECDFRFSNARLVANSENVKSEPPFAHCTIDQASYHRK